MGRGRPTVSDLRKRSPADRIQAAREFCRQLSYGVALSIEDGDLLIATDYLGLYPHLLLPGRFRIHRDIHPGLAQLLSRLLSRSRRPGPRRDSVVGS